jgi:hypothetical protein
MVVHRLQAAGSSAASVAALHALMTMMPTTFTLGESLVTVQVRRLHCFMYSSSGN